MVAALMLAPAATPAARGEERKPPAQSKGPIKKAPTVESAQPKAAAGGSARSIALPGPDLVVVLVRTTLLTLNDALRSDNFTVLRELASARFRGAHTPGKLSQVFSDLSRRGIDLSAVAILPPQLSEVPTLDAAKGEMRLKGIFAGKPVQIAFDLLFAAEDGRWKLLGLSVQPEAVEPQVSAPRPASQPAAAPAAR